MPTRIDDVLLDDTWVFFRDGADFLSVHVVVGRPVPVPDSLEARWSCPVVFEGLKPEVTHVEGIGPLDAAANAFSFIRRFADGLAPSYTSILNAG